jgi:hypothetical protein
LAGDTPDGALKPSSTILPRVVPLSSWACTRRKEAALIDHLQDAGMLIFGNACHRAPVNLISGSERTMNSNLTNFVALHQPYLNQQGEIAGQIRKAIAVR